VKLALVVLGGLHPSGRIQVVPAWLWLIERLARRHEVHAYVLQHLPDVVTYTLAGATIHDLGRPRGLWRKWKTLRRALVRDGPFDVLHGFWIDPAGLLAAVAGYRLGTPALVTCASGEFVSLPDLDYGVQRTIRGRASVRLACRLASRIHVETAFMEKAAVAHGHSAIRIPIGIDRRRGAAPAHPAEGPPWRAMQVASLNPVKDHATLLEALAIARQSVDVRLDLVGEDTLGGSVQRQAAALGIADVVVFHGFVGHDELAPLHRVAHLYVQASRHEAGGTAVLEAAAAGIPIVGTRVGFVHDWEPAGAVATPPGNAPALADAIVRLLHDPVNRRAIADTARRFVLEHDADYSAAALSAVYESLAGSHKRIRRLR
jgi:glycosyltransferase involved in cell wall biosynthesis